MGEEALIKTNCPRGKEPVPKKIDLALKVKQRGSVEAGREVCSPEGKGVVRLGWGVLGTGPGNHLPPSSSPYYTPLHFFLASHSHPSLLQFKKSVKASKSREGPELAWEDLEMTEEHKSRCSASPETTVDPLRDFQRGGWMFVQFEILKWCLTLVTILDFDFEKDQTNSIKLVKT